MGAVPQRFSDMTLALVEGGRGLGGKCPWRWSHPLLAPADGQLAPSGAFRLPLHTWALRPPLRDAPPGTKIREGGFCARDLGMAKRVCRSLFPLVQNK